MDHQSLSPCLSINFHSNIEKPVSHYTHSIQLIIQFQYTCIRVSKNFNSHSYGKRFYLPEHSTYVQLLCLCSYRPHLFPKLVRSASTPHPFSEVVPYICKPVRLSCHTCFPCWDSPDLTDFVKFAYIEVHILCCKD